MSNEEAAIIRKLDDLRLMEPGRAYSPLAFILTNNQARGEWEFYAAFAFIKGSLRFFDNYAPAGSALASRNNAGEPWEIDFKGATDA